MAAPSAGDEEIINISSVKQIREVFKEFKRLHLEQQQELNYARQHHSALSTARSTAGGNVAGESGGNDATTAGNVGSQGQVCTKMNKFQMFQFSRRIFHFDHYKNRLVNWKVGTDLDLGLLPHPHDHKRWTVLQVWLT